MTIPKCTYVAIPQVKGVGSGGIRNGPLRRGGGSLPKRGGSQSLLGLGGNSGTPRRGTNGGPPNPPLNLLVEPTFACKGTIVLMGPNQGCPNSGLKWGPYYPSWYYSHVFPMMFVIPKPTSKNPQPYPIYALESNLNLHISNFKKTIKANGETMIKNIINLFGFTFKNVVFKSNANY